MWQKIRVIIKNPLEYSFKKMFQSEERKRKRKTRENNKPQRSVGQKTKFLCTLNGNLRKRIA